MFAIVFVNGNQRWTAEVAPGANLAGAAVENGVAGVDATCGFCCSCATCHGYVGEAGMAVLPPPSEDERALLEALDSVRPDSRLLCQVEVTPALDGLVIEVAPHQ
ncbi:2Fe-2S iron-sulfur cluster-binding protein [Sinimarinibacterium thermocellulolyticum]|uniref:2Fe-2S iron-sulfur cluster-binding protein n=1 Tax=Sinimarinibacterium thermocellulolyticum TaxID=3170016 RepID=A0ABV2A7S8_9GAMM